MKKKHDCSICRSKSSLLIDEDLRRGVGLGTVVKRYKLNSRATLGRHRQRCLGLTGDNLPPPSPERFFAPPTPATDQIPPAPTDDHPPSSTRACDEDHDEEPGEEQDEDLDEHSGEDSDDEETGEEDAFEEDEGDAEREGEEQIREDFVVSREGGEKPSVSDLDDARTYAKPEGFLLSKSSPETVEETLPEPSHDPSQEGVPSSHVGAVVDHPLQADENDEHRPAEEANPGEYVGGAGEGEGEGEDGEDETPPPTAGLLRGRPDREEDLSCVDDRVEHVAWMIATGRWKGTASIRTLAKKWRVGWDAVRGYFRMASVVTRIDRGDLEDQREVSAGTMRTIRDECRRKAKESFRAAEQARKAKSFPAEGMALKAAAEFEKNAIAAQTQLDRILGTVVQAKPNIQVVNILQSQEFGAVIAAVERGLAEFPEARARVVAEIQAVLVERGALSALHHPAMVRG